jgi:hypothetical protein
MKTHLFEIFQNPSLPARKSSRELSELFCWSKISWESKRFYGQPKYQLQSTMTRLSRLALTWQELSDSENFAVPFSRNNQTPLHCALMSQQNEWNHRFLAAQFSLISDH